MGAWLARTAGGISLLLVGVVFTQAEEGEQVKAAPTAATATVEEPEAVVATMASTTAPVVKEAPRPLRHGVFRFTSYPAAWTAAQKSNRPILVYASAPSCPHCVKMLGETYKSKQVSQSLNDSFETVYVDRAEQPELTLKLNIRLFPSTIVVAPNNEVIDVIEGYIDAATLNRRLKTAFAATQPSTQTR